MNNLLRRLSEIKPLMIFIDRLRNLNELGVLVLPNQGEAIALDLLVHKGVYTSYDLTLKLFKSNTTPANSDTEATYTEADFTGYADVDLVAANWTITPGSPSLAEAAQQTFTSSAGSQNQPVYGYYLVQTTGGKLVWAERFTDGPYTIVNLNDVIKVTPKITFGSTSGD